MTDWATTSVRVPGKVMLAGEYAVLDGGEALAVTVDRYLTVDLRRVPDLGGCRVSSELWSELAFIATGANPALYGEEPLLAAVAHAMRLYRIADAEVEVSSDLTISYGIGSSSALRLGVMMAFSEAARKEAGQDARDTAVDWHCAREALRLQRLAQTRASGYDLATQLVGGLCRLRTGTDLAQWPAAVVVAEAQALAALPELVQVFVGGAGAPTAPLLQSTYAWLQSTGRLEALQMASAELNRAFLAALAAPKDLAVVGRLVAACTRHRGLFLDGPAFPTGLASDLEAQPGCDQSWSFKTTGAGGEDAVLLIGARGETAAAAQVLSDRGWEPLAAAFCSAGATLTGATGG